MIHRFSGIVETVKFDHIKRHYYDTYGGVIDRRIMPRGPAVNFNQPEALV